MRIKPLIVSFVIVLLAASCLYAGGSERIGSAGAQELRIPVGSRASAMAGANIADVSGAEALFWNPAGVAHFEGTEAMFTHLQYIADINVDYFGVMTNIEDFGSIGLHAKVVSIGEMEVTTTQEPQGTGETFSPTFSVIGATYSRVFTDRVSFGMTANLINEKIEQVSANGLAFDFGFIYDPLWRGFKFAIAIKNYGPQMRFSGEGFNLSVDPPDAEPGTQLKTVATKSAQFELPAYIQLGASWDAVNRDLSRAVVVGSFQANNFSEDEFRGGIEYSYDDMFFLRGGYVGSSQDSFMYGLTLGAGLKYAWGQNSITFDYSWVETDFFDNNQYFTAKFAF
ncbi:MAG: PorV/PorQ family protein [Candidatus Zixiibacteriota bacterium]